MIEDFPQVTWDEQLIDDCRHLIRLAVREDLHGECDWTTVSLVPAEVPGTADIVARQQGVIAGLRAAELVLDEMQSDVSVKLHRKDGDTVRPETSVARLLGSARDILTSERLVLNFIGRMSGIASLTQQYVQRVRGTGARIYDTRKTTPGWRRLEKYAARCGGGTNHRSGLFAAVLIKDNHLALSAQQDRSPAAAVRKARSFLREARGPTGEAHTIVEVEVDTLDQLREVLEAEPDIVLLDNMSPAELSQCVELRNAAAPGVQLEASGRITLETVREISETGVERISVGVLTHSAPSFDVGLDWL